MNEKPNDGGPAFPQTFFAGEKCPTGMSLRAWLAGGAMQGILASYPDGMRCADLPDSTCNVWANASVRMADALIAELNKEKP